MDTVLAACGLKQDGSFHGYTDCKEILDMENLVFIAIADGTMNSSYTHMPIRNGLFCQCRRCGVRWNPVVFLLCLQAYSRVLEPKQGFIQIEAQSNWKQHGAA